MLQVEALAQLGGICMLDPEAESKTQFFFGGVEKCRWKKPVVPGDCLVRACSQNSIIALNGRCFVEPWHLALGPWGSVVDSVSFW